MPEDFGAFVPGERFRIAGRAGGPLSGLTFAAKDLFDVAGRPTGGGNPDWARTHPIPERHAWAVQTLLDAGAELIGRRSPTKSRSAYWERTRSRGLRPTRARPVVCRAARPPDRRLLSRPGFAISRSAPTPAGRC